MSSKSEAEIESEVSRNMSADKMADIENQLDNLSDLSPERCIYRVPERLRQVNEKAYTPQVVSIGPLHHGKKHLKAMEEHKLRYLRHFLNQTKKKTWSDYIQKIKDQEKELRGCYAQPIMFDEDKFVRIVSVDAAFVIEVLLRYTYSNYREDEDDYVFSKPTMIWDVIRDLKLLENQLPFFILQDLCILLPPHQRPSLLIDSYKFFQREIYSEGEKEKFNNIRQVKHFVDLLFLPLESETTAAPPNITVTAKPNIIATAKPNITATPNVTELHQAGVKFKVGKGSSLFDIQFSHGILKFCRILEIPKLTVDDNTDVTLRNLLAFEQCHHGGKGHLANYVNLMKRLVKTKEDVQLLVEAGIIVNWLGDTQKVSNLLCDLGTGMVVDDSHYAPLCEDLMKYRRKHWRRWMVILKQNYFNTPWSTISVVAAVILLILTFIQTACSLKSVPLF